MNLSKIKSVEHRFSNSEMQAMLCALPLIIYHQSFTPHMKTWMGSASKKLIQRSTTFKGPELNAIATAVELSIQLLSGRMPAILHEVSQNHDWYQELKRHFFVLNSLYTQFQQLSQEFGSE